MKTVGQTIKMLPGAMAACVLPMVLGLFGAVDLFDSIDGNWRDYDAVTTQIIFLPIFICFVFGTPLAAWLACRGLRKNGAAEALSYWTASAAHGLWGATLVQISAAFLHILFLGVMSLIGPSAMGFDQIVSGLGYMFLVSLLCNLFLWVFITLPFTLLCATIFWIVTKFPSDIETDYVNP